MQIYGKSVTFQDNKAKLLNPGDFFDLASWHEIFHAKKRRRCSDKTPVKIVPNP
jgi:hypothetical protein